MKKLYTLIAAALFATGAVAQNPSAYFMEGSTFRSQFNPAFAPLRGYVNIPVLGGVQVNMAGNIALDNILYPRDGKLVTLLDSSVSAADALSGLKQNNLLGMDFRMNVIGFGAFTKNHKNFWSFDLNVPEEINRRIIDHIADFNLVYTENSRRHLLAEGLPHRHTYVTGSPMYEVLNMFLPKIKASKILETLKLEKNRYFIVSCHREENVDYPGNLRKILTFLNAIAAKYDMPVVVSTHPRTRKRIEALDGVTIDPRVQFLKPFGFFDYNALQLNAKCAISDSGTISEESSMMNFPAITIRQALERPEAMDAGTIILTGLDPEIVLDSIALVLDEFEANGGKYDKICPEYQVTNTSWRVLKLLLGTARLANRWRGVELKK